MPLGSKSRHSVSGNTGPDASFTGFGKGRGRESASRKKEARGGQVQFAIPQVARAHGAERRRLQGFGVYADNDEGLGVYSAQDLDQLFSGWVWGLEALRNELRAVA